MGSGNPVERPHRQVGQEFETVEVLLEGLAVGRGGVLLLTGEPGIGKAHLAEEPAARAGARGAGTWRSAWYLVATFLVFAFEMIHDLARPQQALATMRQLDMPPSVLHCLPVGMAEGHQKPPAR